jgi:hypothetical protein
MSALIRSIADRQRQIERVVAAAFDKQRAFVCDESHKQYLLCPRRAGKSVGDCLKLFRTALKWDGVRCIYVGLTRGAAKKILWDELQKTAKRFGIQAHFHKTDLVATLTNGSTIELVGMDADKNQRAKALGGQYKIVIVDEAASYRVDLAALMRDFFDPGTADLLGMIVMTGTPDPDEARGYFYEVSTGKRAGWSAHTWDTLDNPHMRANWQARLDEMLAEDPLYAETAAFLCMFKGQWSDDPSGWVYKFNRDRNLIDAAALPRIDHRVISIDLGWNDATAITEAGWSKSSRGLYVLHAEKWSNAGKSAEEGVDMDGVAAAIQRVIDHRPNVPHKLVVDGAGKQYVMELRKRYQLPLQTTEKQDKAMFIRLLNTEMVCARVKLVRGACKPLIEEWTGADEAGLAVKDAKPLIWDKRALAAAPPRLEEDPRCKNDQSDSMLYAFRHAWDYIGKDDVLPPVPGTEAEAASLMAARRKRVEREQREEAVG